MTIIVGCHHNGVTAVGSDTGTSSDGIMLPCGPKIVECGKWAVGVAGDLRALTLIEHKLKDDIAKQDSAFGVCEVLRQGLIDDGFETSHKDGARFIGVDAMIASSEGVWEICGAFSLAKADLVAIGSGRDLALGAAHALNGRISSVAEVVRAAIGAAIKYSKTCGGGPYVRELEKAKEEGDFSPYFYVEGNRVKMGCR